MGTNYYARINTCDKCKRHEEIHIGKSSFGWRFGVEIHEEYYKNTKELFDFLTQANVELFNEYGEQVAVKDFITLIENKKDCESHFKEYPDAKYADDKLCDLSIGEFS